MLWKGQRGRTLQPRGIPEIYEHLRSCCQAMSGELECLRRALLAKAARLFDRINFFHQSIGLSQVSNIANKGIVQLLWSVYESSQILCRDVRSDIRCLELRVDVVERRITVRIRSHPSVVPDGCVQRLRSIGDVMAHPTGIKDNRL